jgi:hypothetical protein
MRNSALRGSFASSSFLRCRSRPTTRKSFDTSDDALDQVLMTFVTVQAIFPAVRFRYRRPGSGPAGWKLVQQTRSSNRALENELTYSAILVCLAGFWPVVSGTGGRDSAEVDNPNQTENANETKRTEKCRVEEVYLEWTDLCDVCRFLPVCFREGLQKPGGAKKPLCPDGKYSEQGENTSKCFGV